TEWSGYKVHLTESCEAGLPHLITNIETTAATTTDYEMTPTVHAHLAEREVLPAEHFVDTGSITADQLVDSQQDYAVELVGPVQTENSWQARANEGFASGDFVLDWEAQQATCPRGQTSRTWRVEQLPDQAAELRIRFAPADCQACPTRAKCTKSQTLPRQLTLRGTQAAFEALQSARQQQQTQAWQVRYRTRAGVEGTLSQATNPLAMREARYCGQTKTHLQLAFTAAAMNLMRVANWLAEVPLAQTRTSHFAALAA
ncbi:MAG: transposase, partial [Ardenticatenaceae bacterium]